MSCFAPQRQYTEIIIKQLKNTSKKL